MKIVSIIFCPNGQTAVGDEKGQQVPEYQGRHYESIELLKADGIDYRTIPDNPMSKEAIEELYAQINRGIQTNESYENDVIRHLG
jgi:hypothetical protein